jgi:hypothetical protein
MDHGPALVRIEAMEEGVEAFGRPLRDPSWSAPGHARLGRRQGRPQGYLFEGPEPTPVGMSGGAGGFPSCLGQD